jgi:tetratricopeptide (TPR) repeat protein
MKSGFAIALIAIAMLCASAVAQEMTAEDWSKKGEDELFNNSSFEGALQAFNKAVDLDSGNATLWLHKAQVHEFMGDRSAAEVAYNEALNLTDEDLQENPDDADAWWNRGVILDSLDRQTEAKEAREKAVQVYNQSLASNPEDGETWFKMAEVLVSLNRKDEAIAAYEKSIGMNSSKAGMAAISISHLLAEVGRYDEALVASDRALNLTSPDNIQDRMLVLDIKGVILEEAKRPEEALQVFDEALKLYPGDRTSLMYRASVLKDLHRYNESAEAYQKAIDLVSNESNLWKTNAWIGKGDALNASGRKDEALEAYRSALEVIELDIQENPENSRAWERKGRALYKMGEYEEAIEAFDRSIEVSPPSFAISSAAYFAREGKGDVLLELGRNEEALEAYRQAIELYPLNGDAWHGKGAALQALGKRIEGDWAFMMAEKLGYRE